VLRLCNLAQIRLAKGDSRGAGVVAQDALTLLESSDGNDEVMQRALGLLAEADGDVKQVAARLEEQIAAAESDGPVDLRERAICATSLADSGLVKGGFDEVEGLLRMSLEDAARGVGVG
jgi:uncharacterized membrane protein YebE (DUF533 family)